MKLLLTTISLLFCFNAVFSQKAISTVFDFKVEEGLEVKHMEPASDGGFYAAGFTMDTITFKNSIAGHSFSAKVSGDHNIFLLKVDKLGKPEWLRTMYTSNPDKLEFQYQHMHVDPLGNAHIMGYKEKKSTTDSFLIQQNDTSFIAHQNSGHFIAKYNAKGQLLKTTSVPLPRPVNKSNLYKVASDSHDNYFVAMHWDDEFEVGKHKFKQYNRPGTVTDRDIVVFKLTQKGDVPWADAFGGYAWFDNLENLVFDGNDGLYVLASTGKRMLFYDGKDSINGKLPGMGVLVKYNTKTGKRQWHTHEENRFLKGEIAVDKKGNVFMTGSINRGIITIDGKTYGTYNPTHFGAYISKYSAKGKLLWLSRHGCADGHPNDLPRAAAYVQINELKTDLGGNVYATGFFRDSIFLKNGDSYYNPEQTSFFSAFDTNGEYLAFDSLNYNIPARSMVVTDTGRVFFDFLYGKDVNVRGEKFTIGKPTARFGYSSAILTYGSLCNKVVLNSFTNTSHCKGSKVQLTALAPSFYPPKYSWFKDKKLIGTTASLKLNSFSASDTGMYQVVAHSKCGIDTSNAFKLGITAETAISGQPQSAAVCHKDTVSLTAAASGHNNKYQWYFNGNAVAGAMNNALIINQVGDLDTGQYQMIASGKCGTDSTQVVSVALLRNTGILTDLVSDSVCENTTATFNVVAKGDQLTYSWLFNGNAITNTGSTLSINNVTSSNAGSYQVEVSGTCGSKNSSLADLVVDAATSIAMLSNDTTLCEGDSLVLNANGSGVNLTYAWLQNGLSVQGAQSTFAINAAAQGDEGTWKAVAAGKCGTDTSTGVEIDVLEKPSQLSYLGSSKNFGCEGESLYVIGHVGQGDRQFSHWVDPNNSTVANGDTLWLPMVTVPQAGNYSYVAGNKCGVDSTTVPIYVDPIPLPSIQLTNGVFKTDSGYASYQWYKDSIAITGAASQSHTPTANGHYHVEVSTSIGCKGRSKAVYHTIVGGGQPFERHISIYPNPVNQKIMFSGIEGYHGRVMIYNQVGQTVESYNNDQLNQSVDVSRLKAGVYFVAFEGVSQRAQFVKL